MSDGTGCAGFSFQRPHEMLPALVAPLPLLFRPVSLSLLDAAHAIEAASYPADEAASRDNLEKRLRDAAPYFYGAFDDSSGALRGFVCGTCTSSEALTEEAMSTHEPDGAVLCIHSVVVDEAYRRRGVGAWMLRSYLAEVAAAGRVRTVLLLCKPHLEAYYASAGFASLGDSGVSHGATPWTLMRLGLRTS